MTAMDGSSIKTFVASEQRFNAYVDKKFDALDTDHDGSVTQSQLKPVVKTFGEALGLPPMGTSAETDHIYQEVCSEFTTGGPVRKDVFARVLKDFLLGLADGLERDPINIVRMDGTQLFAYATSRQFETDTVSAFTRLDIKQDGRLQASRLLDVLLSISIARGMPPATDSKMKGLVQDAVRAAGVDAGPTLDQMQFVATLRTVLLRLADVLKTNPVQVAHSEKVYDGQSVKKLLANHDELHKALDESWGRMPTNGHHVSSKDYLRVGVDEVAPAAGLPPVGSVDEIDELVKEIFDKFKLDDGASMDQDNFEKYMLEVLGSLMLQLEGKPIKIESSKVLHE